MDKLEKLRKELERAEISYSRAINAIRFCSLRKEKARARIARIHIKILYVLAHPKNNKVRVKKLNTEVRDV